MTTEKETIETTDLTNDQINAILNTVIGTSFNIMNEIGVPLLDPDTLKLRFLLCRDLDDLNNQKLRLEYDISSMLKDKNDPRRAKYIRHVVEKSILFDLSDDTVTLLQLINLCKS